MDRCGAIALVDSYGQVKGKKVGTATITCEAQDGSGVTATCKVTVREKPKGAALAGEGGAGLQGLSDDPAGFFSMLSILGQFMFWAFGDQGATIFLEIFAPLLSEWRNNAGLLQELFDLVSQIFFTTFRDFVSFLRNLLNGLIDFFTGLKREKPKPEEKPKEDPIVVNGWLKLYASPTVAGTPDRIIDLEKDEQGNLRPKPAIWGWFGNLDVSSYSSNGDYTQSVRGQIERAHPVVVKYIRGARIDENGRYWIYVGPNVLDAGYTPGRPWKPYPAEFNWNVKIDIVVRNKNNPKQLYYVPCVPGGIKGHTWRNGIFQTGYRFPNGDDYHKDNIQPSAVEFMAIETLQDEPGFDNYEAVSFRIYSNGRPTNEN